MKKLAQFSVLLIFIIAMVAWGGCAGGKKTSKGAEATAAEQGSTDDYDEIEKLLGIDRQDAERQQRETQTAAKTTQPEKKDDLINLLEVDEGKKKTTVTESSSPEIDKRIVRLKKQVERLQKELRRKDLEIADLKAKLLAAQTASQSQASFGTESQGSGFYQTPAAAAGPISQSEYEAQYKHGLELFHQRKYREALSVFEKLLAIDTNNNLADNAQYWIGECYYAMGRYKEAIIAFEKVFTFKFSNKNDYAQFKIGQCYYKLGDRERARQEFQELLDNYPNSELVTRAKEYLAQL